MGNECCFRPRLCTVRFNWAGDNLGWILLWIMPLVQVLNRSTCWPAVQHATTVLRTPPIYLGRRISALKIGFIMYKTSEWPCRSVNCQWLRLDVRAKHAGYYVRVCLWDQSGVWRQRWWWWWWGGGGGGSLAPSSPLSMPKPPPPKPPTYIFMHLFGWEGM